MEKLKAFYKKFQIPLLILLAVVALVLPLVMKTSAVRIYCRILMYCTLAGSLNVINGYSGQTCLGQAGFFAVGAYTMSILIMKFNISFWLLLPVAGIMAALVGGLISIPTLRMKGIYLSMVTLGAAEMIRIIALNWTSLTGGAYGIKGITRPILFGMKIKSPTQFAYLFLAIAVLFIFVTRRVLKSRVGRAWLAIREGELAAKSLGVESARYKVTNFMYGAFWAGIAGAVYAPYLQYIDSNSFTLNEGFNILSMVILGGQGTLAGPVVGSILVNVLTEVLRPIGNWRYVFYATLIIAMMWVRPQGVVGVASKGITGNLATHKKKAKTKKSEVSSNG